MAMTRRLLASAIFLALLCGMAWGADAQPFVSRDGRYRVIFPAGTMISQTNQKQSTFMGDLDCRMCVATRPEIGYFVGYVDYPTGVVTQPGDKTPMFEAAASGIAQRLGGHVVSTSKFNVGPNPGYSASFTGRVNNVDLLGQINMILAGNRLYMMYAMSRDRSWLLSNDTRTFFSSFTLLQ